MRGILGYGGYVPYHRLSRATLAAAHGGGPAAGSRAVASYDEDTTSMGVEAARVALRSCGDAVRDAVEVLWFCTTAPAYLDKTNATAVHAALRLGREAAAFDALGSVRSSAGALRSALGGAGTALVVCADARTGLPGSADEREGGDGAAALLVGEDGAVAGAPVVAEHLGGASVSEEFVDRWRVPGDLRSRQWEERFGETRYIPLAAEAWKRALDAAGLGPEQITSVVVAGPHARAVKVAAGKLGAGTGGVADDRATTVGNTGAAHAALLLCDVLEGAAPGQVIALVSLADGCDVFLFRTTDAIASYAPHRSVAAQIDAGDDRLGYLRFLSWKGIVTPQPPNRPEPARASSSAAARNEDWKFGLVASRGTDGAGVHAPPVPGEEPAPLADAIGTIATYTIDRLAYSPSPPVIFAVVDFDGGGRLPIELTDVDAAQVGIGDRVEMTFRRLNQADGIQNYFWKAKPVR